MPKLIGEYLYQIDVEDEGEKTARMNQRTLRLSQKGDGQLTDDRNPKHLEEGAFHKYLPGMTYACYAHYNCDVMRLQKVHCSCFRSQGSGSKDRSERIRIHSPAGRWFGSASKLQSGADCRRTSGCPPQEHNRPDSSSIGLEKTATPDAPTVRVGSHRSSPESHAHKLAPAT